MRCNKCNKEWSIAKATSIASSCPFCGSALNSIHVTVNDTSTANEVVKKIVDAYGEDIIQNSRLFLALFGDLAPHLKREKKIFSISMTNDVMSLFENCAENERTMRINRVRSLLEDVLSDGAIEQFLSCMSYALGWEYEKTAEKSVVSEQNPPAADTKRQQLNSSMSINEKAKLGLKKLHEHNHAEAEPLFKEVAAAGHIDGYYGLGCLYFVRDNDKDKAIDYLNKAIAMGPDMSATSAKLMCGVIYSAEKSVDNWFKAIEYFESVLDEETNEEFHKTAQEQIEKIRDFTREAFIKNNTLPEEVVLEAIREMNNDNDKLAEKILKTPIIMGSESSWFAMGFLCYRHNRNEEALIYLNRYIKRAKKLEFNVEVFITLGKIYEEEGDRSENDINKSQILYTKALSAIRSAINCKPDGREILEMLKESHSRVLKKHALLTVDEMSKESGAGVNIPETSSVSNSVPAPQNPERKQSAASKQDSIIPLHQQYVEALNVWGDQSMCSFYLMFTDKTENNSKLKKKITKKIEGAVSTYAQNAVSETVYMILDRTLFGSGKEGFLLTGERLYWNYLDSSGSAKLTNIDVFSLHKVKGGNELHMYYYDDYNIRCEAHICTIWIEDEEITVKSILETFVNIRKKYDEANKN